jgi:hypothetical protein
MRIVGAGPLQIQRQAVFLAIVVALPISVLAIASFERTASRLADPCTEWISRDAGNPGRIKVRRGNLGAALQAGTHFPTPCANRVSETAETRHDALVSAALIPGGLLLGSVLGIAGALASLPFLLMIGAAILLLESIFVSVGPVIAIGAALFLVTAYKVHKRNLSAPQ